VGYGKRSKEAEARRIEVQAARRATGRALSVSSKQIAKPARRKRCRLDLAKFCKTYFAVSFCKPWSKSHRAALARLQHAILHGGQVAFAMPRGEGKSTIAKAAALWALLYGHRRYLELIAATEKKAEKLLKECKTYLRFSDLLNEDFPEVCLPIRALNGLAAKANGQEVNGHPSEIEWTTKRVVLPVVHDFAKTGDMAPTSGAVLEIAGLTGDIRGRSYTRSDGAVYRPDFALIDDPQTKESAESDSQCDDREEIVQGDVMGLAGPGETITAVITATIIRKGDLADRMLDRKRNPDWQGSVSSMVVSWPSDMRLWSEYNELRKRGLEDGDQGAGAKLFYKQNRAAMDAGAEVGWEQRKAKGDVSALQHAMDLFFRLGKSFFAEYQNQPQDDEKQLYELDAERVAARVNGIPRRELPESALVAVSFLDINRYGIHWVTLGASNTLAGYVCDYGKYPPGQQSVLWSETSTGGRTEEQAIFAALQAVCDQIVDSPLTRHGQTARVDRIGVDCGYKMDVVFKFAASYRRAQIIPSRGMSAKDYRPRRIVGKPGTQCHVTDWYNKGRVLVHDADHWREQMQRGFMLPPGSDGSVSLYGDNPRDHAIIAEQASAEVLTDKVQGNTGWLYRWRLRPGHRNDLGDCLTGARVQAHFLGCDVNRVDVPKIQKQTKRATYTEV